VKHSKLYSDGQFVKECVVADVDILYPNNSSDLHTISLSHFTVTRCTDKLAANLKHWLTDTASECILLSHRQSMAGSVQWNLLC
jgi:hypothetical protein